MTSDDLIQQLEHCTLPESAFGHRAHVQAGFAYLQRHGYAGALGTMGETLRRFAAHHGKEDLYHETITAAFLALIHERMAEDLVERGIPIEMTGARQLEWEQFEKRHPDLFSSDLLERYYGKERLDSELARCCFILPGGG